MSDPGEAAAHALDRLKREVDAVASGRRTPLSREELDAFARQIRPDAQATIDIEMIGGSPAIVVRAVKRARAEPSVDALSVLSAREREVATLVAGGLTNAEIADRLGIRVSTVKDHVHRILRRLEVRSRQEVVARVLRAEYGG